MAKQSNENRPCKVTKCGFPSRKLQLCDAHWMQQRLGIELRPVRRTRKVLKKLQLLYSNDSNCTNCNCRESV